MHDVLLSKLRIFYQIFNDLWPKVHYLLSWFLILCFPLIFVSFICRYPLSRCSLKEKLSKIPIFEITITNCDRYSLLSTRWTLSLSGGKRLLQSILSLSDSFSYHFHSVIRTSVIALLARQRSSHRQSRVSNEISSAILV